MDSGSKTITKDTEHVFEVQYRDPESGVIAPMWLPAFRVGGKLVHRGKSTWDLGLWMSTPKLVQINDLAHLLTPAQLADMRRP